MSNEMKDVTDLLLKHIAYSVKMDEPIDFKKDIRLEYIDNGIMMLYDNYNILLGYVNAGVDIK